MFKPYRMSGLARRLSFAALTRIGLTYSRQTPVRQIHDLFKDLWPVDSGHALVQCGPYLFPEDIGPVDVLFSPGVGQSSDFELAFARRGIPCHLADASVVGPAVSHPCFHFVPKFIGRKTEGLTIGFQPWVESSYPEGNSAVLQMDIEGGEYESILGADTGLLKRFKAIVLEVHCLNILTSQEGFLAGAAFFDRLHLDFLVRHFHVNNYIRPIRYHGLIFPSDIELTLIRRDLCSQAEPVKALPHPMDTPSSARKKDPRFHCRFENGVILNQA